MSHLTRLVRNFLFLLMSVAPDGCAVKMHTVKTDMGVIDDHWERKHEDLGPAVQSATTDGTNLSISAQMQVRCTDQQFETHVMRSHLVPDGSRLPWMTVASLGFSAVALTGIGIASYQSDLSANGDPAASEGIWTGGIFLGVAAGVPAVIFDLSLLRTFGRMGPYEEEEHDVRTRKNEPYLCDPRPFTGKADVDIQNVAGALSVSRSAEFTRGETAISNADIPLSYWENPNWKFKLVTVGTGPKKPTVNVHETQVTVEGEIATALRHAKEADKLRVAKEAEVAAEAERAQQEIAKIEARTTAAWTAALKANTVSAFSNFIQMFPDDRRVAEAQERLKDATKKAAHKEMLAVLPSSMRTAGWRTGQQVCDAMAAIARYEKRNIPCSASHIKTELWAERGLFITWMGVPTEVYWDPLGEDSTITMIRIRVTWSSDIGPPCGKVLTWNMNDVKVATMRSLAVEQCN